MKLNQTQRLLLVAADRRKDGRLCPPARPLTGQRRKTALGGLRDAGLIAKIVNGPAANAPEDDFAFVITAAGRDVLAAEQDGVNLSSLTAVDSAKHVPINGIVRSKIAQVLALLEREQGATLVELGQMTDWLPHSVRAALTGLRKKGHAVERGRRGEVTVYFLKREG